MEIWATVSYMDKNSKGFAHLEIIIILAVVVVIGIAGWFLYSNNRVPS
jgi:hypothetical protein